MARVILALALLHQAAAVTSPIAGYTFVSDCDEHAEIDLDAQAIDTATGSADWATAMNYYVNGGFSTKGTGYRTLKGFSKALTGETEWQAGATYWGSDTYANTIVMEALNNSMSNAYSPFTATPAVDLTDTQRDQIVTKGVAYINANIYSLHELYSAIGKCQTSNTDDASGAPHAWDEGWAFYAGSLQSEGGTDGYLGYTLAEKRCTAFGTCGEGGISYDSADRPSLVNRNLVSLYTSGLAYTQTATRNCSMASYYKDRIVEQMTIPLVQGIIQYAYKADPSSNYATLNTLTTSDNEKAAAELWAFSAALLGQINACSTTAAATVMTNAWVGSTSYVSGGYAAVKSALEGIYSCLGITCSDVGVITDMTADTNYAACSADSSTNPTGYPYSPYAGYAPASDVTKHALIDVDMYDINIALDSADYATAISSYKNGGNSIKGSGYRTLKSFSKTLTGETEWQAGATYYGSDTYANTLVMEALNQTEYSPFAGTSVTLTDTQRDQIVTKGVAYMNGNIYSLHELYSAIEKCEANNIGDASGAPHAWDEGWVFYAGSMQTYGATNGYLGYTLAEKRCTGFSTCGSAGTSSSGDDRPSLVNRNLLTLYKSGLTQSQAGDCTTLTSTKDSIVQQMTIPLVQGIIQYAYKSDPVVGYSSTTSDNEKAGAELWAFSMSLLGQINACSSTAATTIYNNAYPAASTASYVPDGYAAVKSALEGIYSCLGITCADVGNYVPTTDTNYAACSGTSTTNPTIYTEWFSPTAAPVVGTPSPTACSPAPTAAPVVGGSTGGDVYRLRRLTNRCDDTVSGGDRTSFSTTVALLCTMVGVAAAKYL